jgi:hypothetical protein
MSWEEIAARWENPEDFILWVIKHNDKPENPIIRVRASIIGENMPNEDWLPQCVPFTGVGADQTTGVEGLPADVFVEDLVKTVIVFDDNTEDGLAEIRKSELAELAKKIAPEKVKIANIKFWEARIPADVLVIDALGKAMSREAWFHSISPVTGEERKTDGLAIWAAKKMRLITNGGGVHF